VPGKRKKSLVVGRQKGEKPSVPGEGAKQKNQFLIKNYVESFLKSLLTDFEDDARFHFVIAICFLPEHQMKT